MTITTIIRMVAAAVVAAGVLASSALAGAETKNVVLKATLTGPYLHTTSTGSGSVTVTITPTKVCWKLTYTGLDQPGVSGIHIVPPPPAGEHKTSVFPFTATTSTAPGCDSQTKWGRHGPGWVAKIVADPSRFYVIVGTTKYPQGAIGGALSGS